jgi:hypothetical protein
MDGTCAFLFSSAVSVHWARGIHSTLPGMSLESENENKFLKHVILTSSKYVLLSYLDISPSCRANEIV